MYILALTKFKGGVGATETTVNLAQIYAIAGWRVLVIDTDPQGGASERLPGRDGGAPRTLTDAVSASIADRRNPKVTLGDVIRTVSIKADARRKESVEISIVPANRELQDEENSIGNMPVGRTKLLKRMLATVSSQFDICLIDTPPVFGYLSRNAIVAADGLLLPLLPEPASFKALGKLRAELDMMAEEDEVPAIVGTVLNRVSSKSDRHQVGELLLQIAAGERSASDLQMFSVAGEFDLDAVSGLNSPCLGSVANDNALRNDRKLRKAYMPIAQKLAKQIGLGVLNINIKESHDATISA